MTREKIVIFEWDRGNIDKNYQKHGIAQKEAEEIFLDENLGVLPDIDHSQNENRLIALGKTVSGKVLFAIFTVRSEKIRIISVRIANQKERRVYEKNTQKNT
jgi:uncharacterized protein